MAQQGRSTERSCKAPRLSSQHPHQLEPYVTLALMNLAPSAGHEGHCIFMVFLYMYIYLFTGKTFIHIKISIFKR